MTMMSKFVSLFGVPEFVVPHLSRFVSEGEMGLVVRLDGEKCSVSEIAARLDCTLENARVLSEACYYKHIVHKEELEGEFVYFSADFYELLDYLCKFDESYQLMDQDLRKALDRWCFGVYAERMDSYLNSLILKETVERAPETFLLLKDLEEVLESVGEIRLVPCNCRKLARQCVKPTGTCLSFDEQITDRTFGSSLTKEEAMELVKLTHEKGLMHQINSDWQTKGPAYICNCCSCCCYPLRLAQEKGTQGIFPLSKFVAQRDDVNCLHCGACIKRCHFGAFSWGETEILVKGKSRKRVEFDQTKCWGCGICEEVCPSGAIFLV